MEYSGIHHRTTSRGRTGPRRGRAELSPSSDATSADRWRRYRDTRRSSIAVTPRYHPTMGCRHSGVDGPTSQSGKSVGERPCSPLPVGYSGSGDGYPGSGPRQRPAGRSGTVVSEPRRGSAMDRNRPHRSSNPTAARLRAASRSDVGRPIMAVCTSFCGASSGVDDRSGVGDGTMGSKSNRSM